MYLGSSVSSTESDISMHLAKVWSAIDRLSIVWKSDLSNKIKRNVFQTAVVSIPQYGCAIWTPTKCIEKKLNRNCPRMLRAILKKSWKQHPMKQHLYGHPSPISKTIKVRRTRYMWHSWRNKDKLISYILLWTPSQGRASVDRPTRTYPQQVCTETGYSVKDLPKAMDDRHEWRECIMEIRASGTTWWWWYIYTMMVCFLWSMANQLS